MRVGVATQRTTDDGASGMIGRLPFSIQYTLMARASYNAATLMVSMRLHAHGLLWLVHS